MKLRPIKLRITLLNLMLAIAVLCITLAICQAENGTLADVPRRHLALHPRFIP